MEPTRERRSIFDRVTKGAIFGVAAAALAIGLALPNDAATQEPADGLKRFILIGLCEPVDDSAKTLIEVKSISAQDEGFQVVGVQQIQSVKGLYIS